MRAQAAVAQLLVNGSGVRWVQARAEAVLKRMPGEVTVILHDKRVVVGAQLLVTCGRKARVQQGLALAAGQYFSASKASKLGQLQAYLLVSVFALPVQKYKYQLQASKLAHKYGDQQVSFQQVSLQLVSVFVLLRLLALPVQKYKY